MLMNRKQLDQIDDVISDLNPDMVRKLLEEMQKRK